MRKFHLLFFIIVLIGLSVLVYYAINLQEQSAQFSKKLDLITEMVLDKLTIPTVSNQEHAVIFLVKSTPTDFFLVPINREIGGPVNPKTALQALINGPLANEELFPAVPLETKLLGLSIHNGLATANFSSQLVTQFNGGSLLESYLVQAIVNTLTEFPEISEVQILVEGERIESVGGHILILDPLRR